MAMELGPNGGFKLVIQPCVIEDHWYIGVACKKARRSLEIKKKLDTLNIKSKILADGSLIITGSGNKEDNQKDYTGQIDTNYDPDRDIPPEVKKDIKDVVEAVKKTIDGLGKATNDKGIKESFEKLKIPPIKKFKGQAKVDNENAPSDIKTVSVSSPDFSSTTSQTIVTTRHTTWRPTSGTGGIVTSGTTTVHNRNGTKTSHHYNKVGLSSFDEATDIARDYNRFYDSFEDGPFTNAKFETKEDAEEEEEPEKEETTCCLKVCFEPDKYILV
jgi:hypothetical protein